MIEKVRMPLGATTADGEGSTTGATAVEVGAIAIWIGLASTELIPRDAKASLEAALAGVIFIGEGVAFEPLGADNTCQPSPAGAVKRD